MGFTLLHAGLAAGAALAAIPVILHLILKQKPRHELFPALRLIRQRHRVNLRRLRIRHWLLLAMRMLLIALMAFALARPSIHGASFIPDQQAPVAAALVFDTSLSMQYQDGGRTRLEAAQLIAKELIKEFPAHSEAMVLDSADPTSQFDLSMARQRIESLRLRPRATSVNQSIIEACRALDESDRTRKEVFVFTDLTAGSFAVKGAEELQKAIGSVKGGVAIYVLNVGVEQTKNVAFTEAGPSAQVVPANSGAVVSAVVQDAGQGEEVLVELLLDEQTRGSQQLVLEKGRAARVEFRLPRLEPKVHQGQIILRNGGGLEFDDTHFVTIEVRPITRVLLVSDIERDAERLKDALAPSLFVEKQIAWYQVDWIPTTRLSDTRLAEYSVVGLVNVAQLPAPRWAELEHFVMSGGGLAVFLGPRVQADSYNQDIAQNVLPVKLGTVQNLPDAVGLQTVVTNHAAVQKIHAWDESLFGQAVVERYIRAEPSDKSTRRVLDFTDGAVALAERPLGGKSSGRVVAFTTSVSPTPRQSKPWNDLPGFGPLFVPLSQDLFNYLAGHTEQRLNYQVGEDVVLRPDRGQKFGAYLLHSPDAEQATRRTADPNEGSIVVPAPEPIGNYVVSAGQGEQPMKKGFSVNPRPAESTLDPLPATELAAVLGDGIFAVARTADELHEVMGDVRIGRELFPWLMPLIVCIFAMEHLLANRFYKKDAGEAPVRRARTDRGNHGSMPSVQERQTAAVVGR